MACTFYYDIIIWTDPSASTTVADFPCPWFLENMSTRCNWSLCVSLDILDLNNQTEMRQL